MQMHVILLFVAWCCLYNQSSASSYKADSKLSSVVVLYRHGDRTPKESYPKDPFFNKTHIPEGLGAFLNKGRLRHYNLGQWFRQRYGSLLSQTYKKNEIKVYSADTDTCLMSAQCNLAGLYKLKEQDEWYTGLPWEPIPVHTRPEDDDYIFAMEAPCSKYEKLLADVKKSQTFANLAKENADMFKVISEKTGWDNIQDIDYIRGLYSVFYIYSNYNTSYIPSWFGELNKTKFNELSGLAWARETYTPELKRLKTGPFFNTLFTYFDQVIAGKTVPKFTMIASSIRALTAVLNTMDVFDNYPIEFGATIIWELSKNAKSVDVLSMYYKKFEALNLIPLVLKGCPDVACEYETVKKVLSTYAINKDTWVKECNA